MSALVLLKVQTMHVQHRYQDETNLKCRNTDHSQQGDAAQAEVSRPWIGVETPNLP